MLGVTAQGLGMLNVSWMEPVNPSGIIISYRISWSTAMGFVNLSDTGTTDTQFTITDLQGFTNYTVMVQAENGALLSDPAVQSAFTAEERRLPACMCVHSTYACMFKCT